MLPKGAHKIKTNIKPSNRTSIDECHRRMTTVRVRRGRKKGLMETVDGARFSQNEVLQMEVIAHVELFVSNIKLIQKV